MHNRIAYIIALYRKPFHSNGWFFLYAFLMMAFLSCNDKKDLQFNDERAVAIIQSVEKSVQNDKTQIIPRLNDSIAKISLTPSEEFSILTYKYSFFYGAENFTEASAITDSMKLLLHNYPDNVPLQKQKSFYLICKADVLLSLKYTDKAFKLYDEALKVAQQTGNNFREGTIYYRMAMSYYKRSDFAAAAENFKHAYEHSSRESNAFHQVYFVQEVLNDIGLCYTNMQQPQQALLFYLKAEEYLKQYTPKYPANASNFNEAFGYTYRNLGETYDDLEDFEKARLYLNLAISAFSKRGNGQEDVDFLKLRQAQILVKLNKPEEGLKLVQSVNLNIDKSYFQLAYYNFFVLYYLSKKDADKVRENEKHAQQIQKQLSEKKIQTKSLDFAEQMERAAMQLKAEKIEKDENIFMLTFWIEIMLIVLAFTVFILLVRLVKNKRIQHKKRIEKIQQKENQLKAAINFHNLNFDALMMNVDDILWTLDINGNLLSFNQAYADFCNKLTGSFPQIGFPEKRISSSTDENLHWRTVYNRCYQGEPLIVWIEELKMGTAEEDTRLIEFSAKPVYDDAVNIIGVSCKGKDVTETVNKLKEIEVQNEKFKNIYTLQSHKTDELVKVLSSIVQRINQHESPYKQEGMIMQLREKTEEIDAIIKEVTNYIYSLPKQNS